MRILNLYAGIGGNRKEWGNEHEITAVEYDSAIAKAYQERYPNDEMIIGDAKQYLLDNYKRFDFIWISPPCQTHSTIINSQYTRESHTPKYPDMTLYQIVSFLQRYGSKTLWVVENVKPYYKAWIDPTVIIDRHYYWSNFQIDKINVTKQHIIKDVTIDTLKDFDISKHKDIKNKRQVIRNQVNYGVGKHILTSVEEVFYDF